MIGILYAIGAAALFSAAAILAKMAIKECDASLGAALAFSAYFLWKLFYEWGSIDFGRILRIKPAGLFLLLCLGVFTGLSILFFFCGIKGAESTKILILQQCRYPFAVLSGILLFKEEGSTMKTAAVILCVAGMLVVTAGKNLDFKSALFGLLSGISGAVLLVLADTSLAAAIREEEAAAEFFCGLFILILLWIIVIAKGEIGGFHKISFVNGVLLCAAGIIASQSRILRGNIGSMLSLDMTERIFRGNILLAVLFAAIFLKEGISGRKWIGAGIFVVGLELLLMAA